MKIEIQTSGSTEFELDAQEREDVKNALLLAHPEDELMYITDTIRSDMETNDYVRILDDDGSLLWAGYM